LVPIHSLSDHPMGCAVGVGIVVGVGVDVGVGVAVGVHVKIADLLLGKDDIWLTNDVEILNTTLV